MSEKITYLNRRNPQLPTGAGTYPDPCGDTAWHKEVNVGKGSEALIRLMVRLEGAVRAELPLAKRLSLVRDMEPLVTKAVEQLPKPVVTSRQMSAAGAAGQTLEQRLNCLMAKNLKLALDSMGYSDLTQSDASKRLRLWLVRELFRYLGRSIEYAVRWDRPYPSNIWSTLHDLYLYLVGREDSARVIDDHRRKVGFDPAIEYKRLLLLGLAGQVLPVDQRSPWLLAVLASLANESHLKVLEGYRGSFDLYVVEIAKDEPPHLSGVIEYGMSGWVFEPAPGFFNITGKNYRNRTLQN